jgi:hypothetical protein
MNCIILWLQAGIKIKCKNVTSYFRQQKKDFELYRVVVCQTDKFKDFF